MSTPDAHEGIETGLDQVAPESHPARSAEYFRRIVAANASPAGQDEERAAAVAEARAAGDSWAVIGAALGTSGQNAY